MSLEILQVFLITLGVFISIILIGRLIQLGKILMSLNISIVDILYLIFYLSPFFLFVLMPVSGMLALFVTFQRMSTDNELVALRSGGISLYNILPCPIFILLIFTGINFFYLLSRYFMGHGEVQLIFNRPCTKKRPNCP